MHSYKHSCEPTQHVQLHATVNYVLFLRNSTLDGAEDGQHGPFQQIWEQHCSRFTNLGILAPQSLKRTRLLSESRIFFGGKNKKFKKFNCCVPRILHGSASSLQRFPWSDKEYTLTFQCAQTQICRNGQQHSKATSGTFQTKKKNLPQ